MTDNAVKLMLGKLNKMTSNVGEQIEIINQSILGGWTGIYPLKQTRKEPVPKWMPKKQNEYDFDELEKALAPVMVNDDPKLKEEAEALKKVLQENY